MSMSCLALANFVEVFGAEKVGGFEEFGRVYKREIMPIVALFMMVVMMMTMMTGLKVVGDVRMNVVGDVGLMGIGNIQLKAVGIV